MEVALARRCFADERPAQPIAFGVMTILAFHRGEPLEIDRDNSE